MTSQPDLSARYGRRAPAAAAAGRTRLSRRALTAIVLALLAASGLAGYVALSSSQGPQGAQTLHYQVVDSTLARVSGSVVPDTEREIVCGLQVTSEQDAVVGYAEVVVPPDPNASASRPVALEAELATTQLADSGHLDSCWFADEPEGS